MMNFRTASICFLLVSLIAAACSDDKKNPVSDGSDGKDDTVFYFPYHIDNSWTYHATAFERNPDDLTLTQNYELTVDWIITSVVVTPAIDTFGLQSVTTALSGPDSGYVSVTNAFYAVDGDTLQAVFREGQNPWGTVFHKPAKTTLEEEYSSWALNVLVFPFEVGNSWPFSRNDTDLGMKKVESFETVKTAAGTLKTYRVVREVPSVTFTAWWSSIGMAKKKIEVYHESEKDNDGKPLVLYSLDMELVDYSIHH